MQMPNKLTSLVLGCVVSLLSHAVLAADAIAKEETTPPAAAGALTADQIRPIQTKLPPANAVPPTTPAGLNPSALPALPGQPMQAPTPAPTGNP